MPPHILALANTFFKYYSESSPLAFDYDVRVLAEKILKFFDISYEVTTNTLIYRDQERITEEDCKRFPSFSIHTKDLSYQDLVDMEELLSKPENKPNALKLSCLFDSIGWIIHLFGDRIKLSLIGNECRESWKDLQWDLDAEETTDWKDIIGPDGIDFKQKYKKDWLKEGLQNE